MEGIVCGELGSCLHEGVDVDVAVVWAGVDSEAGIVVLLCEGTVVQ